MKITVKNLIEMTADAFKLSIEFKELGKTNEAFLQYGRGKAYLGIVRDLTGWNVNDFAPELKELDDKAWRKLYWEDVNHEDLAGC